MQSTAKKEICFVDYEYACLGPMELDIANHWSEWSADYNADRPYVLHATNFPTKHQQTEFLRHYLTAFGKEQSVHHLKVGTQNEDWDVVDILPEISRDGCIETGVPTEMAIEQLRTRVLPFVPLVHLMWMLWSVIQDAISDVDFDFRGHAEHRWQQINSHSDNDAF